MIVAVTGANGFIGRHLCAGLTARGHEARPVLRRGLNQHAARDLLAGVDVVVHAAAATRAPTRQELRASNVDLTASVVDGCRAARVKRLVFISSQAAAGPAVSRYTPVREDDSPAPVEEYGRTKLAAERAVEAGGVPFTIVRPSAVYGPDDRDFAALFRLARLGVAIHPGNREQWVSIIHVDDCVEGIVRAATAPEALGRTYFLANDEPEQWKELFRIARAAVGGRLHLDVEIPSALVDLGARGGDVIARLTGRAGLLTSEKVALSKDPFWICSNERAANELAFRPRITVPDGIRSVMTHHRASTNNG